MATFLDVSIFAHFTVIFTFLLVFVIVYGFLQFSNIFGKLGEEGKASRGLHGIIALATAILSITSDAVVALIAFMVPWFFIAALAIFLIIFIMKMFTGDTVDFAAAITGGSTNDTRARNIIIVVGIVIMIFGFGNAFGQSTLEQGTGVTPDDEVVVEDPSGLRNDGVTGQDVATDDFSTNVLNTIVNPKVLGIILMMIVSMFSIIFLTD